MSNCIQRLETIFKYSEILMRELEEERDESLENLRFEGEEEILIQYYKKILMSIYRMRNNLAALLLRHEFGCTETEDQICMEVNGVRCEVPKQALKNILQKEFDSILAANNNKKEYSNPVLVKEGNKPTLKTITEAKNEETVKAVIPENRIEIQENNKIRNVTKKIPKTEDAKKNRKPLPIEPDLLDMDFFGDVEEEAVQGEKNVEKKGPDIPLVKPSSTVIENKEDEPIHKAQEIHKNADPFEEFIFLKKNMS